MTQLHLLFSSIVLYDVILFVSSLAVSPTTAAFCPVSISEILLGHKPDQHEFIELRKHCEEEIDLSRFLLVAWVGAKSTAEQTTVKQIANFAQTNCTKWNKTFMVIGPQAVYDSSLPNTTQFCPFEYLGADFWRKGQDFWLDKANMKTVALVLYENLTEADFSRKIGTKLDNQTAHRDKIMDLVFYFHKGSAHGIKDFLFPDYQVGKQGTKGQDYFRLPLNDSLEKTPIKAADMTSFGFCCSDDQISSMWPLGFKLTVPTPGSPNLCRHAKFALDSVMSYFDARVDRCNRSDVENFHPVRPSTVAPPSAPSAKKLGLAIGIPVGTIVVVLVIAVVVFVKRRSYDPLRVDRGLFSFDWFRRNPERAHLTLDT